MYKEVETYMIFNSYDIEVIFYVEQNNTQIVTKSKKIFCNEDGVDEIQDYLRSNNISEDLSDIIIYFAIRLTQLAEPGDMYTKRLSKSSGIIIKLLNKGSSINPKETFSN